MGVVLMRLAGPMQSWGVRSRFMDRDTEREPSKSGVVGLLCAAMGISRDDRRGIAEIAACRMAVRVDREGVLETDYHTAGAGTWPGRERFGVWKSSGGVSKTAVVSNRHYLAGAVFLVALGASPALADRLRQALGDPVWPLFLGRRAFPPASPVWLTDGLRQGTPISALQGYPWLVSGPAEVERLRLVVECAPSEGEVRFDVPVSFEIKDRRYAPRHVRTEWVAVKDLPTPREGSGGVPLKVGSQSCE